MYISNSSGNASHIKFGGWDRCGMAPGHDLEEFATVSATSLAVNITNVKFGGRGSISDFTTGKSVLFDPSVQNLHLPESDFAKLAAKVNYRLRQWWRIGYDACPSTVTQTEADSVTQFDGYCFLKESC